MYPCDFNATTPLHPSVAELLAQLAKRHPGNPSSPHASGRFASQLLENARVAVAVACSWPRSGVIFTSGATEALFIAVAGKIFGAPKDRRRVLLSSIEHKAVISAVNFAAEQRGMQVDFIPVTADGVLDLERAADMFDRDVALVCVMGANNETGVLQPLVEVTREARRHDIPVLSDACQMLGKVDFSPSDWGADMYVLSGHKIMGPRGVGALLIEPSIKKTLLPVLQGGGQEGGLRGGTENVLAIAGLGLSVTLAQTEVQQRASEMVAARSEFEVHLQSLFPEVLIHGNGVSRLPNTSFFSLPGIAADDLLHSIPELEASAGSACQSAVPTPSHVLTAMGVAPALADQSVRVSFGPNRVHGVDLPHAAQAIGQQVAQAIGSAAQKLLSGTGVNT